MDVDELPYKLSYSRCGIFSALVPCKPVNFMLLMLLFSSDQYNGTTSTAENLGSAMVS